MARHGWRTRVVKAAAGGPGKAVVGGPGRINQEEQLGSETDHTTQGSSVGN